MGWPDKQSYLRHSVTPYGYRKSYLRDVDLVGGYREAPTARNLMLTGEAISGWNKARAGTTANSVAAPIDQAGNSGDTISEDATAGATHLLYTAHNIVAGVKYGVSLFGKAINRSGFAIAITDTGSPLARFDLSAGGAVFTQSATLTNVGVEDWSDGWVRCHFDYTAVVTGAATHWIQLMEGQSTVFDGLNQTSVYAAGFEIREGGYVAGSYMPCRGVTF